MPTGTIKKLVSDRGFGFIAAEDGREYFFHRTGLDSSVNFEPSQKGPRANRIKLA
jgi:cold shock CspA family protein